MCNFFFFIIPRRLYYYGDGFEIGCHAITANRISRDIYNIIYDNGIILIYDLKKYTSTYNFYRNMNSFFS